MYRAEKDNPHPICQSHSAASSLSSIVSPTEFSLATFHFPMCCQAIITQSTQKRYCRYSVLHAGYPTYYHNSLCAQPQVSIASSQRATSIYLLKSTIPKKSSMVHQLGYMLWTEDPFVLDQRVLDVVLRGLRGLDASLVSLPPIWHLSTPIILYPPLAFFLLLPLPLVSSKHTQIIVPCSSIKINLAFGNPWDTVVLVIKNSNRPACYDYDRFSHPPNILRHI